MNAIELLKKQHREVEELFKRFESAGGGKAAKTLLEEIALRLSAHAAIEERLFYPEGEEVDEDATLEAFEEHGVVKDLIKKIGKTRANDRTLEAKGIVLKEVVEHHVEEEENEYFPECEKAFGEEKLETLGSEMEVLFEQLMSGKKVSSRKKAAPGGRKKATAKRKKR